MRKVYPPRIGQWFDVLPGLGIVNELKIRFMLAAKNTDNQFQLVEALSSREDWFPTKNFSKDASYRPNVNGDSIIVTAQEELWCTVPASNNILCHELAIAFTSSCQPKITYLQVAISIDKEVPRLQVPVKDVCWMKILEPSKQLECVMWISPKKINNKNYLKT